MDLLQSPKRDNFAATAATYQSSWTEPFTASTATQENKGITSLEIVKNNSKTKAVKYSNDRFRKTSFR